MDHRQESFWDGLTPQQIEIIVRSNNRFDGRTQSQAEAYLHSMLQPRQSLEDGRNRRQAFREQRLRAIRESRARRRSQGDKKNWSDEELRLFGELQHPFVDQTCTSHNWQVWSLWKYLFDENYYENHKRWDKTMTEQQTEENIMTIQELLREAQEDN